MRWEWHQMDNMQIICTSFQTDNHASTSPLLIFYKPDVLPDDQPTVSKHWRQFRLARERTWNHSTARTEDVHAVDVLLFAFKQLDDGQVGRVDWRRHQRTERRQGGSRVVCVQLGRLAHVVGRCRLEARLYQVLREHVPTRQTDSTRWRRNNQPTGRCQSQAN